MAEVDDEVVVFLIGMRVNRPWLLAKWLPTFMAMPKMLKYLVADPERGLLGFRNYLLPSPLVVQYWRSVDDLYAFARNTDDRHLEARRRFNRKVGSHGDVGIWHDLTPGRGRRRQQLTPNTRIEPLLRPAPRVPRSPALSPPPRRALPCARGRERYILARPKRVEGSGKPGWSPERRTERMTG
jgi:hypothetical protein